MGDVQGEFPVRTATSAPALLRRPLHIDEDLSHAASARGWRIEETEDIGGLVPAEAGGVGLPDEGVVKADQGKGGGESHRTGGLNPSHEPARQPAQVRAVKPKQVLSVGEFQVHRLGRPHEHAAYW